MARVRTLAGKPIEQHSSPNQGGAMSGHKGVVLHIAQGGYRGTISWQMNPDQKYADGTEVTTCSTWIIGRETGEWAQMVDSNNIAWCQRSGSRDWLSIELAGFAPNPPTAWQIEACAQLLAWSAKQHGHVIEVADNESERGLGHHSMDRESFGVEWGHDSCPGSGVIAAKAAIVKRAKAIAAGEDNDVTPEEHGWLKDVSFTTTAGIPNPAGDGRVPLHVWAGWMTGTVKALGNALSVGNTALAAKLAEIDQEATERAAAEEQRDADLKALVEQHASGELSAEAVVQRLADRLAA